MFIKFDENAQKIIKKAKIEMQKLKHPFIGSEHLMLSILHNDLELSNCLKNYGITYDVFYNELVKCVGVGKIVNKYLVYTPLLKRVLENVILDVKENSQNEITVYDIFLGILDEGEGVAIRILYNLKVNVDEMYLDFSNKFKREGIKKKSQFNTWGIDLCKKAERGEFDPLIGREEEIERLVEILGRRNKNNPLLIGEAGVGKTAIIEELARRIVNNNVPFKLRGKRIISVSMANMVSGTKYRGEFEEKITKLLKEVEDNDDVILFIDEIHTIVGAGGAEGAIDASNIIKPSLARGKIRLIGATTIDEFKKTIYKDKALERRFQALNVNEPNRLETINILKKIKGIYEDYHRVKISDDIIEKIVILTDKYIFDKRNPDKSIDILDEVCASVSLTKDSGIRRKNILENKLLDIKKSKSNLVIDHNYIEARNLKNEELKLENKINRLSLDYYKKDNLLEVTINDVSRVIKNKASIPVFEIDHEYFNFSKMETYLNRKVIGQEEVIKELIMSTKKMFLGYKDNNLPISFLFAGSSGVGKTLLAKEYSNYLNINFIRVDMSEYRESHSVSKIIGSPSGYIGYDDNNYLLEKIKNNPFSVLLLDEIEKASHEVINLFLQVLDNGFLTDSKGNKVSFQNVIIIMTSNIGFTSESIGFNSNFHSSEINDILSTIFVNRINKICYFKKLDENIVNKIVQKKIADIRKKYGTNIKFRISKKTLNLIFKDCNYDIYGARKLNKILEDRIDNVVIDGILKKKKEVFI